MEKQKHIISQSLMNEYRKYKKGESCGEYLNRVYLLRDIESETSDPMRMGSRFEYEALGNMDYHGNVPEPFMNKNGSPSTKQFMIAAQVQNFKEWFTKNGYEILERGVRHDFEFDDFILSGMIDLVFKDQSGKVYICDLKMSGNLGNKESEWGWDAETILTHDYKITQVIFYLMLVELKQLYDTDTFVFYVASSRDQEQFQAFEIHVSEEALHTRWDALMEEIKEILFEADLGFTPRPSGVRCSKCPVKDVCTFKDADMGSGVIKLKL